MTADVKPRRGRPPTGLAAVAVHFRIATADAERIRIAAQERGLTEADVFRWLLRRGLRQIGELPARRPTPYGIEAPPEAKVG